MEKILSDDEKIRRAEEIYYRRNNIDVNNDIPKRKKSIKDKFFLHLLIMINIAVIVFAIQNKDFIFKEQFLDKINEYNINISSNITNYIRNMISYNKKIEFENNMENSTISNSINDNINNEFITKTENSDENIEKTVEAETKENGLEDNLSTKNEGILSEKDLDIENLMNAYSFINPINGVITSRFGIRNSENKEIDGYHTGLDIAADKGSLICASMQGIVDEVSSVGDYGNHIKIRCNNVTTLYAHLDKILVIEGQIVSQGQTIGTVGSTGNSTGPHLHFEIRIDDRFINPERILKL